MRPLVKWAGGKAKLADRIDAAFETRCTGTYFEPFCGGAAVFLYRRAKGNVGPAVLADANARLIGMYRAVQRDVEAVIDALAAMPELQGDAWPDTYYAVRAAFNADADGGPEQAARLLWLNRGCFNGLYRENRGGSFNVPVGRNKAMAPPRDDVVREVARLLEGVELLVAPFDVTLARAGAGDQVYCDPPYVPSLDGGGFTSYKSGGFDDAAQQALADAVVAAAARGATVVVSNHDTPAVRRELYPAARGFQVVEPLEVRRSISRHGPTRGPVAEVIARIGPGVAARPRS
jgi:DNA adenine methylase